nr:MAG TPA: hypothetical protein [Inoviridae sp.]
MLLLQRKNATTLVYKKICFNYSLNVTILTKVERQLTAAN